MVKCDVKGCKKRAKYNLQNWWHLYAVRQDKKRLPQYDEIKDWEGEENSFYCEEHATYEGII